MANSNFNAKISKLKQMETFNRSILESIYFKGILPSVTYCISLWGSSNLLADLEDSHIRAARLIHYISIHTPKHEVLSMAKWSSIHHMYKRRLACIAYQAFYNLAPDEINSLFSKHETSYNLRVNWRFDHSAVLHCASLLRIIYGVIRARSYTCTLKTWRICLDIEFFQLKNGYSSLTNSGTPSFFGVILIN